MRRYEELLSPFDVIAIRDGAEFGRCRLMAVDECEAELDGFWQLVRERRFDMFEDSISLRVERADASLP